ncbi:UNVERIFIED_CONTAM: glyoxylase-like metal-dependent hydrolase (beta-lactamase superfamily II) [Brevibacillus sp. OAP136]
MDKMKNAVVGTDWASALPRKSYEKLGRVETTNDWFEVYQLPKDVYAIYEPGHFQEVISYLIIGETKAILLDTGMGIGNIYELVHSLTDKEIEVVNSHSHFDHIGENYKFSKVSIFEDVNAVTTLTKGYSVEELKEHVTSMMFAKEPPKDFIAETYRMPPCEFDLLHDGDIIDLGNRKLKVIHTPGHSSDSIMLHDEENRILFTGDTFYPGALYAHFDEPFYGKSNLEIYLNSLRNIANDVVPHIDYLYCSHNVPVNEPRLVEEAMKALQAILDQKASYQVDGSGLRRYDFDGFAVITKD